MLIDPNVVVSGHRETTALKLIVIHVAEIRIRADVDDLWQIAQPGIEYSRLDHLI